MTTMVTTTKATPEIPSAGMGEEPLLLKVREAARLLNVYPNTVYRLIAAGEMPAVRLGAALRVRREVVEAVASGDLAVGRVGRRRKDDDAADL